MNSLLAIISPGSTFLRSIWQYLTVFDILIFSCNGILAISSLLSVWDHNSHIQFQPRMIPRLQLSFSWHVLSQSVSTIPQVAGLGGASSPNPILWQNLHPLLFGKRWRPQLPSTFQKVKEMTGTERVGIYTWVVDFGKQTAAHVPWSK